ncbi:hypothetical protein TIFTF001_020111 [Ficus carica]|uniref:Receptor-like serine/threonine-protein kinase n=1 Tax=Ficus carica TaxID=3494 RepID=A0AA88AFH9_FICCA|nr:hypothetical protein TIFTF001_020111 [Ficus carica]
MAVKHVCTALITVLILFSSKYCHAIDNITASQELSQGQTLISPGEIFELGFFSPKNSGNHKYVGMWFKGVSPQTVVWVANRERPLRVADARARLRIGSRGNLELVDGNQTSVWSTNVDVPANSSVATLSDNGNFVLKDGTSGEALWQSFDNPGDSVLPGSGIGFNAKTGEQYVMTSWKSESDPSVGDFTAGISTKFRPAQIFIWNGTTPHWRSGPWGRLKFVGMPEMDASYQKSAFSLVEDAEQGTAYLNFKAFNSSILSTVLLGSDGAFRYKMKDSVNDWYVNWLAPATPCDVYGACGPFGVCRAYESPICKCLQGFVPKSNEEWSKGNWKQGCVRQTELLCEKNTSSPASQGGKKDGFQKFVYMKIPDFHEYVYPAYDLDTCRTWCLVNCSCSAYALVNGIGCLTWSDGLVDVQQFAVGGEDLFLRLAPKELVGEHKNKSTTIIIIATVSVSSVLILSAILWIGLHRLRGNQKRTGTEKTRGKFDSSQTSADFIQILQSNQQHDPTELPIFDFNSILVATNNFSVENKLGQGGFGPVYKGKLKDGTEIAVKRLSSSSGQDMEEFKNEMLLISKLQHRNLVKLLGCCIEEDEKLLMYEFMPNKSLDNFVFDERRKAQLDWPTRFNIINGVARGLAYLHRDSCLRIIYRDLKVSNILLDENMNPKISDFGLARIFQGTIDLENTRRIVGTLGYMSPEYALRGIFSEKSDVFSFCVLTLEIVTGRKITSFNYDDQHQSLIAYVWHLWSERRALDMTDKVLEDSYSSSQAMRCIHVGLLCVQDHDTDRPTMPDVIFMLNKETDLPQPKQPFFTFERLTVYDLPQQSGSTCSMNEVTTSILHGR